MLLLALIASLTQSVDLGEPFEPRPHPISKTSSFPYRMLACDLDGDAAEEILLSGLKEQLGIVREDAEGALLIERVPFPTTPSDFAVEDLDGDGAPDVALATSEGLFLLWNSGTGELMPAERLTDRPCTSVEIADLDDDGRLDLFYAGVDVLAIQHNLGSMEFEALPAVAVPCSQGGIATGDWNGDGLADVATADWDAVHILLGDGEGGFLALPPIAVAYGAKDLRPGDIDGNGLGDLVVIGTLPAYRYLLGVGEGWFAVSPASEELDAPRDACVSDVDGDGRDDVTLVGPARSWIEFGPHFSSRVLPLPRATLYSVAVARLVPGRSPRIVGFSRSEPCGNVALGRDLVRYVPGADHELDGVLDIVPLAANLDSVILDGDFDGDGLVDRVQDVTKGTAHPLMLLRGSPQGWEDPRSLGFDSSKAGAADVDGDGDLDLVLAKSSGAWVVRLGDGAGSFSGPVDFAAGLSVSSLTSPPRPWLPDLDSDGRCDVIQLKSGALSIHLGLGDGTFVQSAAVTPKGTFVRDLVDVDGNGTLDVVLHASAFLGLGDEVWLSDGQGGLLGPVLLPLVDGEPIAVVAAGDLDLDGHQDLVSCSGEAGSRRLSVHPGLGGAAWGPPRSQRISGKLLYGAIVDVDTDGLGDLVARSYTLISGFTYPEVWRGDGLGELRAWSQPVWRSNSVDVRDVDGDGLPELVGDDAILTRSRH